MTNYTRPTRGDHLLCADERCPTCLHPAWAHVRKRDADSAVGRRCIGQDCRCRALAR